MHSEQTPEKSDKYLDLDVLFNLFGLISEMQPCDIAKFVYLLDGDGYDDKKYELTQKLAKGEKIFVISVYQTIGAGQNLQYNIPEEVRERLIRSNDREGSAQKDFDAIYLDKPTNLTVNMFSNSIIKSEDFVKFIFETEYLQENGEISAETSGKNIRNAFGKCYCGKTFKDSGYSKTPSVCYYATKQIVQAIDAYAAQI